MPDVAVFTPQAGGKVFLFPAPFSILFSVRKHFHIGCPILFIFILCCPVGHGEQAEGEGEGRSQEQGEGEAAPHREY
jgi:hypothetical protein